MARLAGFFIYIVFCFSQIPTRCKQQTTQILPLRIICTRSISQFASGADCIFDIETVLIQLRHDIHDEIGDTKRRCTAANGRRRALIREPDLVRKMEKGETRHSLCNACNLCVVEMERNGTRCVFRPE